MGKGRSRARSRAGDRAGGTDAGKSTRRRAGPDARRRRTPRPRGAGITLFHVRDSDPVNELMSRVHRGRRGKTRPGSGVGRGGRAARSAGGGDHPPLFRPDDRHLVGVAGSLAGAKVLRDFIRETLGDAVEHVRTEFIKAPRAVGGARSGLRRRR